MGNLNGVQQPNVLQVPMLRFELHGQYIHTALALHCLRATALHHSHSALMSLL
jgi:hypothetical protein